jgi:hypothetical protein
MSVRKIIKEIRLYTECGLRNYIYRRLPTGDYCMAIKYQLNVQQHEAACLSNTRLKITIVIIIIMLKI